MKWIKIKIFNINHCMYNSVTGTQRNTEKETETERGKNSMYELGESFRPGFEDLNVIMVSTLHTQIVSFFAK